MSASHETRLSVLEQLAVAHEKRISNMEEFHREIVDRLDQKIQLDVANQVVLERTLAKAVVSLDGLNDTVKRISAEAEEARTLAKRHETIGNTLIKVGAALSIFVGAAWAIFKQFFA